jgi:DNA-binding MarR family transcriptional regulator
LVARAGLDLDPRSCWILLRLQEYPDDSLGEFARHLQIPAPSLVPFFEALVERGLAVANEDASGAMGDDTPLRLTAQGRLDIELLVVARRDTLAEFVADWSRERHAELGDLLTRLAQALVRDPAPGARSRV